MPVPCFSYSSDVPLGIANRGAATGLPRRPAGKPQSCFSYSPDAPLGIRNGIGSRAASDLPRRPAGKPNACFSYQA
jgi:hypothetical protein